MTLAVTRYGLIFHSSFIGRAGTKNKGRISRYLANKASIASRANLADHSTHDVEVLAGGLARVVELESLLDLSHACMPSNRGDHERQMTKLKHKYRSHE